MIKIIFQLIFKYLLKISNPQSQIYLILFYFYKIIIYNNKSLNYKKKQNQTNSKKEYLKKCVKSALELDDILIKALILKMNLVYLKK